MKDQKQREAQIFWCTEVKAKSPKDGSMKTYGGPDVPGDTLEEAQEYCESNGLGYCWVIGQLIADIPCIEGTYDPDWENATYYKEIQKLDDNDISPLFNPTP